MKENLLQKMYITIIMLSAYINNSEAQIKPTNTQNRIITSVDFTSIGPQGSIAYDFYCKNGTFVGFSFSQQGGFSQLNDDSWYYNSNDVLANFNCRITYTYLDTKVFRTFIIGKAGLAYNTKNGKGLPKFFPTLNLGAGADIYIVKSSGLRLEAGLGMPHFISIGYFINL